MSFYSSSPETSSTASYYTDPSGQSRPASASPTFVNAYPQQLYKMRLDAGRGFDPEDDTEFCPALTPYEDPVRASHASRDPVAYGPAGTAGAGSAAPAASTASAPTLGVRARKALEIIDPVTGMRVR